jgi:hypothetical protein
MADRVKNTRPRADGDTSAEDIRLAKYYENPELGEFEEPATVLDRDGHHAVAPASHIFSVSGGAFIFFFVFLRY